MACFFFSSRRRHTILQGDWSSDVCSSDLDRAVKSAIREFRSLTPDALDALERAVRERRRVALRRRGTEYVVVAERLNTLARDEALEGRLPMTGEVLAFPLRELESFAVLP